MTYLVEKVTYRVKKNDKFKKERKEILSQIKTSTSSLSWLKNLLEQSSKIILERIKKEQVEKDGSIVFHGEMTSLTSLEKKINALINKSIFEKKLLLDLYTKYKKIKNK